MPTAPNLVRVLWPAGLAQDARLTHERHQLHGRSVAREPEVQDIEITGAAGCGSSGGSSSGGAEAVALLLPPGEDPRSVHSQQKRLLLQLQPSLVPGGLLPVPLPGGAGPASNTQFLVVLCPQPRRQAPPQAARGCTQRRRSAVPFARAVTHLAALALAAAMWAGRSQLEGAWEAAHPAAAITSHLQWFMTAKPAGECWCSCGRLHSNYFSTPVLLTAGPVAKSCFPATQPR